MDFNRLRILVVARVIARDFSGLNVQPLVVDKKLETVAEVVVEQAQALQADGIILATHGRSGVRRLAFGSVTEEVLRHSLCPVYAVPSKALFRPLADNGDLSATVILLTDYSPESQYAFRWAEKELLALKAYHPQLILLHVVEDMLAATYHAKLGSDPEAIWTDLENEAQARLDNLREQFFSGHPVLSTVIRQNESVPEDVVDFANARGARLLIVATHGRRGVSRALIGSVTERILRISSCPIMVVSSKLAGN